MSILFKNKGLLTFPRFIDKISPGNMVREMLSVHLKGSRGKKGESMKFSISVWTAILPKVGHLNQGDYAGWGPGGGA